MESKPQVCFITDLATQDYNSPSGKGFNLIKYKVNIRGTEVPLMFSPYPSSWGNQSSSSNVNEVIRTALLPYKHILCGLIYNGKLKIDALYTTKF